MSPEAIKIILAVLELSSLALIISITVAIKIKRNTTRTTQKNNIVMGDQIGRDKNA